MRAEVRAVTLDGLIEDLVSEAIGTQGVPPALAERARGITSRNLAHLGPRLLEDSAVRRVRHYFAAVIRRTSVRADTPEARRYRHRLIAASLAADLRAVGMDERRVEAEVSATLAGVCGMSCQAS